MAEVTPLPPGKGGARHAHHARGEINLAILDVVMPELSGRAVFDATRAEFPHLCFLFTTGYSPASAHLEGLEELSVQVLHKPYGFNDLARALRRVIELAPR